MFNVGDIVEYYKKPTQKDWERVGEVVITFKLGDKLEVVGNGSEITGSVQFRKNGHYYPKKCFRLVEKVEPEFIFEI